MVPTDPTTPVRRFWDDVWSRGEVTVLDDVIAPGALENGAPLDVSEFAVGVTDWRDLFADFTARIEEILVLGDRVVTRVRFYRPR